MYLLSNFLSNLVRVVRLKYSFAACGYSLMWRTSYFLIIKSLFFGFITPGRVGGDISRVANLREYDVPVAISTTNLVIERLFDLAVILLVGAVGILYIFLTRQDVYYTLGFLGGSLVLLGLCVNYFKGFGLFIKKSLRKISRLIGIRRVGVLRHLNMFAVVWKKVSMLHFWFALFLCFSNLVQIWFLAKAFGFTSNYLWIMFTYSAASIISVIPITFNGLGTREGVYIMLMGKVGIPFFIAVAFSLLDGIVFVFFVLFVMMIPYWLTNLRSKEQEG